MKASSILNTVMRNTYFKTTKLYLHNTQCITTIYVEPIVTVHNFTYNAMYNPATWENVHYGSSIHVH